MLLAPPGSPIQRAVQTYIPSAQPGTHAASIRETLTLHDGQPFPFIEMQTRLRMEAPDRELVSRFRTSINNTIPAHSFNSCASRSSNLGAELPLPPAAIPLLGRLVHARVSPALSRRVDRTAAVDYLPVFETDDNGYLMMRRTINTTYAEAKDQGYDHVTMPVTGPHHSRLSFDRQHPTPSPSSQPREPVTRHPPSRSGPSPEPDCPPPTPPSPRLRVTITR